MDEPKVSARVRISPRFVPLTTVLIGVVVAVVVSQFQRVALAEAAGASTSATLMAAWLFWPAHREPWFSSFLIVVTAIQAAIVCLAPWPRHYVPNKLDILFWLLDLITLWLAGLMTGKLAHSIITTPNR